MEFVNTYPKIQTKADEVVTLVECAVGCGYEKDKELFDRITGIVYVKENFSEEMGNVMSEYLGNVMDLLNRDGEKKDDEKCEDDDCGDNNCNSGCCENNSCNC